MTVYLLHLDTPLSRGTSQRGTALVAGHYIGWAADLARRLKHHEDGSGARFTQVCRERGLGWKLARVWEGADRRAERLLKRRKNAQKLCPICNPRAMNQAAGIPCRDSAQVGTLEDATRPDLDFPLRWR